MEVRFGCVMGENFMLTSVEAPRFLKELEKPKEDQSKEDKVLDS